MRRRTSRARSFFLAIALIVPACGGDGGSRVGTAPAACPETSPASDLTLVPDDIELDRYATITTVAKSRGFVGVISVSDQRINELFPALQRSLVSSGYEIRGRDNEGFEAEIYFERGTTIGSYRMREGPCADQVTIKLLYRLSKTKNSG